MKKLPIIFIIFLLIPLSAPTSELVDANNGTIYYVDATNGNDANNGTTSASAWKSLNRITGESYNPGDSIFLKRGEVWREHLRFESSGTANAPITIGAYGSGAKPLLLGTITKNNPTDWIDLGNNLWATADGSFVYDVGFMLLGEESSENVGKKSDFLYEPSGEEKDEYGDWYVYNGVDEEGEFWYDENNQRVILYCIGNPTSIYSNIEIANSAHWDHMIWGSDGIQYITIENLELKYFNSHGMQFTNSRGITIRNCDISYGGGTYLERKVRYGNGIEFWNNAADCRVERCKIGMMYDAAVTNQGTADNHQVENISYVNNILYFSEYSLEAWIRPASATMKNVHFENNTCLGAGFGWGHQQRYDPHGWHMAFWGSSGRVEGLTIRYNVFYESMSSSFYFAPDSKAFEDYLLDYNYYYETAGIVIYYGASRSYTMDKFSKYQKNEGQDIHSHAGDKTLVQEAARAMVEEGDLDFLNELFDATDSLALEYSDQEVKPGGMPGLATTIVICALAVVLLWKRKKRGNK